MWWYHVQAEHPTCWCKLQGCLFYTCVPQTNQDACYAFSTPWSCVRNHRTLSCYLFLCARELGQSMTLCGCGHPAEDRAPQVSFFLIYYPSCFLSHGPPQPGTSWLGWGVQPAAWDLPLLGLSNAEITRRYHCACLFNKDPGVRLGILMLLWNTLYRLSVLSQAPPPLPGFT